VIAVSGFISLPSAGKKAGKYIALIVGNSHEDYEQRAIGGEYFGHN